MDYLMYLMSQHKTEVLEVLSADPILKAEIEYDLKNHEKKNRQRVSATDGSLKITYCANNTYI